MRKIALLILVCISYLGFAAPPGLQEIGLRITDVSQQEIDETTINLNYGVGPQYNYTEDSKKILNGTLQIPQIFSITSDNINCLINSNGPFTGTQVIPLGFRNFAAGNFTISLTNVSNVDPTAIIRLEDKQLGIFHHLQQGDYTFQIATQQLLNVSRFNLHISYPAQISTVLADCSNQNGKLVIDQDTTITWTQCQLFNSASQLVATQNNVTGQFSFNGLAAGNYTLAFIYNSYIGTRQATLTSNQISVTIGVATQTIATGQPVQFTSLALNTQHYDWDFGDGTLITEIANPQMIYYAPGVYNVVLTATNNAGCVGYAYLTVTVTQSTDIADETEAQIKVYATGNDVVINNAAAANNTYRITNINGQAIATGNLNNGTNYISLGHNAAGVYIVTITTAQAVLSRKVFAGR